MKADTAMAADNIEAVEMLASQPVHDLVGKSKAQRALNGNLLPLNNNPSILELENLHSVTVVEESSAGMSPVALGIFHAYTPNQIYCSVLAYNNKYDEKFVSLEPVKAKEGEMGVSDEVIDSHRLYKVANEMTELPDLSSYPQYYTVFEAPKAKPLLQSVVDELIDSSIGHRNFDIKRNITVDLYDSEAQQGEHSDDLWRDKAGFVVSDKHRFYEFGVERTKLISIITEELTESDGVGLKFKPLDKSTAELFIEYDSNITIMDRQPYLEFLFALQGIQGSVVVDEQDQAVGYVLTLADRVLQLYAENSQIAHRVLAHHLAQCDTPLVQFFSLVHSQPLFEKLKAQCESCRRVRRFHTRILPANVKWSNVFLLNIGAHLY